MKDSSMRKDEVILPAELWTMILRMLDFPNQCSMLLVSWHIYQVGTHTSFLRNKKISRLQISRHGFQKLFSVTKTFRFDSIKHLDLSNFFQNTREWSLFFRKVSATKRFPDLKLSNVNLCDVPANLLAKAIASLQQVDLYRTRLRHGQCRAILSTSLKSTSLEEVNLGWNDLSRVPASILARAVARLKRVNLEYTWLRPRQVREILRESLKSSSLAELYLHHVNTCSVSPELLAKAVSRLVRVNLMSNNILSRLQLTRQQIEEILKVLPDSTKLISLHSGCIPLDFEKMASEALAVLKDIPTDSNFDRILLRNPLSLTYQP